MAAKQVFRVLNPRGIGEGNHIIAYGKGENVQRWYEGDEFTPTAKMHESVSWWEAQGFIAPVIGGATDG